MAKLYRKIIIMEARRFYTYRSNIFAGCISAFLMLGVRYALWAALFATGNAETSSLHETMTYFVINDMLFVWIFSHYGGTIGADIRSGDIAIKITRPCPYHLQLIAESHAGALFSTLTYSLPLFIAAFLFIGLLPPVSAAAFGFFILSAILGGAIYSLIDLIISYTAYWLTSSWYLSWFKGALFSLFGGIVLPIWFYPGWLSTICDFLPFKYAVFQPMGVYLGRVAMNEVGFSLFMQIFWIALLFLFERFVWRLAQNKLTVQGG